MVWSKRVHRVMTTQNNFLFKKNPLIYRIIFRRNFSDIAYKISQWSCKFTKLLRVSEGFVHLQCRINKYFARALTLYEQIILRDVLLQQNYFLFVTLGHIFETSWPRMQKLPCVKSGKLIIKMFFSVQSRRKSFRLLNNFLLTILVNFWQEIDRRRFFSFLTLTSRQLT